MEDSNRIIRVLHIYNIFLNGGIVNKSYEANKYGVSERTIQRDIDDIRGYLESGVMGDGVVNSVIYDRAAKGYRLDRIYEPRLRSSEILAVCKSHIKVKFRKHNCRRPYHTLYGLFILKPCIADFYKPPFPDCLSNIPQHIQKLCFMMQLNIMVLLISNQGFDRFTLIFH